MFCKRYFLFMLIVCAVICIIYLILPPRVVSINDDQKNVCITEKCVHAAATILQSIDRNIDPCYDFYKFVCGNFINNTIITEEKSVVKTFTLARDKVKFQLKTLLDQPSSLNDSKTLTLLKNTYKSCLNTSLLETDALPFFKKTFKELGGWPLIDPNWNQKKFDWKQTLYRLRRIGWSVNMFVRIFLDADMKNSSRRILTITQPYISEHYALSKGINHTNTQAYYNFMVKMAIEFGVLELPASVQMKEILDFEINLNKIMVPYSVRYNVTTEYNPTTIKELQETVPTIPWLQVINNYLAPKEKLTSKDVINVAFPKFLKNLEDLLLNTNKRILANYMMWYLVKTSVMHLPQKFKDHAAEYFKKVKGVLPVTRWKQCIKELDKLHVATSSIYIKHFFNQKSKEVVTDIASYVKEAFVDALLEAKWMDEKTKTRALVKIDSMAFHIAFPEEILLEYKVEEYHRPLVVNERYHYLKVSLNVSSFLHQKHVAQLREDVVKHDWTSRSYACSFHPTGFYNQRVNAIEVMGALLLDNFFDAERPNYVNFGSIGEIIGHEIAHGFDDEGKQFDENGNLVNWWAPETLKTFTKKSECFIQQYNKMTVPEIKMNVNGANTLDENLADNAGFNIAYKGYLQWIMKNDREPMLPGVAFTQRQIFWISAASNACASYRKEALQRFVISGRHAPEYFRVMGSFMNSEDFARDFNCSLGSRMNPIEKCKLW